MQDDDFRDDSSHEDDDGVMKDQTLAKTDVDADFGP